MSKDKQGQNASINGRKLENVVENIIKSKGIISTMYSDWCRQRGALIPDSNILLKNVPYINMFDEHKARGEFLLKRKHQSDVRIECRGQHTAGTADEKFPCLLGNCKSFKEIDVIVIIEGEGHKPSRVKWFITNALAVKDKNIQVMTLAGFTSWANNNL